MTRDAILAMKPGRELDEEIAWLVMGYDSIPDDGLPRFSTEIEAAWGVVRYLCESGKPQNVREIELRFRTDTQKWTMSVKEHDAYNIWHQEDVAPGDTAPEAVGKTALLVVREEQPMG